MANKNWLKLMAKKSNYYFILNIEENRITFPAPIDFGPVIDNYNM